MCETLVRPLDRQHGVPTLEAVSFIQRVDAEGAPIIGAELQDRDCLIDPAQEARRLGAHLHHDAWRMRVRAQHFARPLEVLVGVEAPADIVDREKKEGRVEALATAWH
jgi:hypothetical protein